MRDFYHHTRTASNEHAVVRCGSPAPRHRGGMTLIRRMILSLALIAGATPALAQVPAPVPALPDTERRTSYSISATTCACAVNFQLYGDGTDFQNWVEVWLNGVQVNYNDTALGWTITSPSGTLANLARPITDAVLTFTLPQTGTVQIVGARRPRRTSQFSENTGVPARNINQIVSDIIAVQRETWDRTNDITGRAVLAPPGETLAVLPSQATRASQGACFNASGSLTPCVSIPSSTFVAGSGIAFTGTNPVTLSASLSAGTGVVFTGTNPLVISAPFIVGTTAISGGTSLGLLYNNGGVIGNSSFAKIITNGAGTPTLYAGTSPSSDDSAILAGRTLAPASGLLNTHAFRDETVATQNVTGGGFSGYSSFDAAATIAGSATTAMNHYRNYQARGNYGSTGTNGEMAGVWVGLGVSAGTVTNMYGMQITTPNITGAGVVTNQFAYRADTLSGAAANWFLFQGGAGNPSSLPGNVYIGGRLSQMSVEVANIRFAGASQFGMVFDDTTASAGNGTAVNFYRNNVSVGTIVTTLTTTAYNVSSDERLKDFVGKYDPKTAIRIIRADPVRSFRWKRDGSHDLGWGAQTSYSVAHDLATPGQGSPGESGYRPWGVDKGKRTPYLWAAMSDVLDRIEALERRLK